MLFMRRGTVIAEGLKITGSVSAEGLVEVNGYIEGDLHCTSLIVAPQASIKGGIEANRVVINGRVEGPIRGGEVVLKSRAHVIGDIEHVSLAIEAGARFEGRSGHSHETIVRKAPDKFMARIRRAAAPNGRGRAVA